MLLRPQLTPTPQEMIDEADRDGDGEVSQDQLLLHLLLHLLLLLLQLLLLLLLPLLLILLHLILFQILLPSSGESGRVPQDHEEDQSLLRRQTDMQDRAKQILGTEQNKSGKQTKRKLEYRPKQIRSSE